MYTFCSLVLNEPICLQLYNLLDLFVFHFSLCSDWDNSSDDELELVDPFQSAESPLVNTTPEERNTVEPVQVELIEPMDTESADHAEIIAPAENSPVAFGPLVGVDPVELDDTLPLDNMTDIYIPQVR